MCQVFTGRDFDAESAPEVTATANQGASIEDVTLVYLTGERVDAPDTDASGAYRLEVNLSPPELMQVTFIMLHGGSDELIVRAKTRESIDQFIKLNDLRRHPRLRRMTITGPGGLREEITR